VSPFKEILPVKKNSHVNPGYFLIYLFVCRCLGRESRLDGSQKSGNFAGREILIQKKNQKSVFDAFHVLLNLWTSKQRNTPMGEIKTIRLTETVTGAG
jgi:hypothetical protein